MLIHKENAAVPPEQIENLQAFTLTELLVVITVVAMLTAVLLSVSFTTKGHVMEAQCVDNLHQVGTGLNVYGTESNDYLPVCGWPSGQHPWQTYSACRVAADRVTITRGFMSLGLLYRTKAVPGPKVFYCPSTAGISSTYAYDYYTISNVWPYSPDGQVRVSYNYYPQLRATATVAGAGVVPKLTFGSIQLEFSADTGGGTYNLVSLAKWTEINPNKSVATDRVHSSSGHRAYGSMTGLNALFPDSRVVFQNARSNPQAFNPFLWDFPTDIGDDDSPYPRFRSVMNMWKP